jgi:hypothetical protein
MPLCHLYRSRFDRRNDNEDQGAPALTMIKRMVIPTFDLCLCNPAVPLREIRPAREVLLDCFSFGAGKARAIGRFG